MKQRSQQPSRSQSPRTSTTSAKTTRTAHQSQADSPLTQRLQRLLDAAALPWKPLVVSLVANLALFALVYALYTPQFNTRDDVGMMLLAAGKMIALQPSEYLLFTNVLIGHLLKAAYSLAPTVSWYAWYLVLTLFVSHVALLYTALKRANNGVVLGLYVLYVVVYGAYMLLTMQFTMVSSIAALAGSALLLFVPVDTSENTAHTTTNTATESNVAFDWKPLVKRSVVSPQLWCGALLLVWAFLVRVESCLLALACVAPVVLVQLFSAESRLRIAHAVPAFVVSVVLCVSAYGYNAHRYSTWGNDKGWTENALEFNRLIADFLDFKAVLRTKVSPQAFDIISKQTGMSVWDYEMLMNWFFMNETLYSAQNLQFILDEYKRQKTIVQSDLEQRSQIEDYAKYIDGEFVKRNREIVLLPSLRTAFALAVLITALMLASSRLGALQAVLFLATVAGITCYVNYLTLMRDAPERVVYPLFAFLALVPLMLVAQHRDHKTALRQATALRLAVAGVALLYVLWAAVGALGTYSAIDKEMERNHAELNDALYGLNASEKKLYVIWADGFPLGGIKPFGSLDKLASIHALWLSWCQRMPTSKEILARYGVRDIYRAMIEREDVVTLMVFNQLNAEYLRYGQRFYRYIKEHYGYGVTTRTGDFYWLNPTPKGQAPDPYRQYLRIQFQADYADTVAEDLQIRTLR